MFTELGNKAFNNISQPLFKERAMPEQFAKIEEAIKGHDINLQGCGFTAIQAKLKLEKIAELDLPNFIETLNYV